MNITKIKNNDILTVALKGRLDTTTSPQLETELEHSLTEEVQELVFDLQELEYMSSAGIRVIMASEEIMSGRGGMKLLHVNEEIIDIFEMTGLIDILHIE